jgi:hypothetical protein
MKSVTWPVAVLGVFALVLVGVIFVGVPMWGIAAGHVPPSFLFVPLGTLLLSASTAVAAYVKGQNETPPWLSDPAIKKVIADSMRPPPPPDGGGGFDVDMKVDMRPPR